MVDQAIVNLVFYKGNPVSLDLPTTRDLQGSEPPPAHKGDTASGASKPATLVTGLVVNVPIFIAPGDMVRIDTRNANYVTRVTN